jgi:hypothetical protein
MTAPDHTQSTDHFLNSLSQELHDLLEVRLVRDRVTVQLEAMKAQGRILDYKTPIIERQYVEVIFFIPYDVYKNRTISWNLTLELENLSTPYATVQAFGRATLGDD